MPSAPTASSATFVLGVGAQKAGTTWLYDYLASSPAFVGGYRKEYHVFDTLDLESERWTRDRNLRLAEESLAAVRAGEPADATVLHRMSMVANTAFYYDYFAGLLRLHQHQGRHLTADVTPAYALLPASRFEEVRRELAAREVRVVPVFLMRDPVDRIWSQIRMQRRRSKQPLEGTDEDHLRARHAEPQYDSRSAYHHTIEALDSVFGKDTHYEFYERLFDERAVARLCDSVGIPMHPPRLGVRRNQAPDDVRPSDDTVRLVATHLADVYRAVARRFPDIDLPAIWPSAAHAL